MSSLGELFFSLGLDSQKFDDAIKKAKEKVAELTGNVSITASIDADASKVAAQVQEDLKKVTGQKAKINIEVDKSNAEKIKELVASIAEAEANLKELETAKVKDVSAITNRKGAIENFKRQLAELWQIESAVNEAKKSINEVAQPSQTVQHVVSEEAIADVKALTDAMKSLNEQMEVSNRLREGQQKANAHSKEEAKQRKISAQWLNETRRKNKEVAQLQKEEEAMRSSVSSKWIEEARQKNAELRREESAAAKQRVADAKASNKALQSQLSQLFKLEEAIKKLQNLRIRLNLSGIDQNSENFKKAASALDAYIDKLQQLQGSGRVLSKREVSSVLGMSMKSVIDESDRYVKEQKAIEKSLIKALSEGSASSVVIDKKTTAMNKFQKAIVGTTNWASQLNNQLGNAFSIYAIERFIRSLYTVGGEFQKQQIALQNMIGDTAKADVIFDRMKDLAVTSPFTFSELASYTKQMSAYGIEYEELYDTTKRLADISAGVGVDMSRIILAYGQVRSAEVLRGQELRQFTEAGIPLVAELAKRLEEVRGKSVAVGEVFDAISKREISFDMVKDVLFDMTDPGGRFFETQEKLAESLAGKWSNLKDAWDIMIADIANGNNSTLKSLAEVTAWLVKNWEAWLPLITGAAAALGAYRTVMAVVIPLQQAFNILTKANPWIAIASGVIGAAAAIYGYATDSKTAADELKELNHELDKNIQKHKENEQTANRYLDSLKAQNTSEEQRIRLLEELKSLYPDIFKDMKVEQVLLADTIELKKKMAKATKGMTLADYDELLVKAEKNRIELQKKYDDTYIQTGATGKRNKWYDQLEDVKAEIRKNKEERAALEKELDWNKNVSALGDKSTLEEYINLYGEIGKAIKILRDAGINNETVVKPAQGIPIDEYYDKLNSALKEQDDIMRKFGSDTSMYKNAEKVKKVYEQAIKSIGGVIGGNQKPTGGKSEAERKARIEGERAAKAFAEGFKGELSNISSKWDLYKQLFELTGDREFASTAFTVTPVWDEAANQMLNKFKEAAASKGIDWDIDFDISDASAKEVYGELYDSWKQIKDRIEKNGIDLKINTANAIKETMSLEDKIKAAESKKWTELEPLMEDSDEYKAAAEKHDKIIEGLKAEMFALTPAFTDLFVDTVGMASSEVQSLYEKAKNLVQLIRNGVEIKNKDGVVTGYRFTDNNKKTQIISANNAEQVIKQTETLGKKAEEASTAYTRLWDIIRGKKGARLGEGDKKGTLEGVASDLASIVSGASEAAQSLSSMFDAFGNDSAALKFELAGNIFGGVSKIGQGIAAKDPFAVLGGITGIITSIAQHHDKKLDKAIQKSQLKVQKLTNEYKNLETTLERQLGSATTGQAAKMMESLQKQRSELQKQYKAEDDKKKTDQSKLEDYKQQITELDDQIKHFYDDLANEQYGIDIKGWAGDIADALTEAFASGEDAAVAFEKTVSDILKGIVKEMIAMEVVMPALENVKDYLFGSQGIATLNSEGGTDITSKEAAGLANEMKGVSSSLDDAKKIWDAINKASGGMLDSVDAVSGGLSKEIQGVTEDTANLLGSYLNSIRQDSSVQRTLIEQLVSVDVPQMSIIAQAQLQQLQQVVANTKRNADAADRIYELVNKVVDKGGNKLRI